MCISNSHVEGLSQTVTSHSSGGVSEPPVLHAAVQLLLSTVQAVEQNIHKRKLNKPIITQLNICKQNNEGKTIFFFFLLS